ncbi:hypothetical protein RI129_011136 [Pyrocoelia pectoralis]|uniref:Uncharacterized protein n=1 Tax=Pyrocoelia pectoralis TaxID=417401 RepID=A0AAN7ZAD3_9COLE
MASRRTQNILALSKQQSDNAFIEYIVGEAGILTPTKDTTEQCPSLNLGTSSLINVDEIGEDLMDVDLVNPNIISSTTNFGALEDAPIIIIDNIEKENAEPDVLERDNINTHDRILISKTRNRRKVSEGWDYNVNKYKRAKGCPYQGKKKTDQTWDYKVNRPGKFLSNPCNCILSKRTSAIQCQKLSEEKRIKIFQTFWNKMTWSDRKIQVQTLVKCEYVKRRRGQNNESKRNFSIKYFLKVDLETIRVCKRMFGGTLGLKETMVLTWIKENIKSSQESNIGSELKQVNRKSQMDLRGFLTKATIF